LNGTIVSALVRALWEETPARIEAAEVLGRLGPSAKSAVPSLENLLQGYDSQARIQAALALWRIDQRTLETIPVLVGTLRSASTPPQRSSVILPGRFGGMSTVIAPLCQQAAEALGQMGPDARDAVPALTEVLKDPQLSSCHPHYALALAKIDRQAAKMAVAVLIQALDAKGHANTRLEAAKALGELGALAREAVPSLRKALDDPDEGVRSEAKEALKKIEA
jgi:HEAT repeat protein